MRAPTRPPDAVREGADGRVDDRCPGEVRGEVRDRRSVQPPRPFEMPGPQVQALVLERCVGPHEPQVTRPPARPARQQAATVTRSMTPLAGRADGCHTSTYHGRRMTNHVVPEVSAPGSGAVPGRCTSPMSIGPVGRDGRRDVSKSSAHSGFASGSEVAAATDRVGDPSAPDRGQRSQGRLAALSHRHVQRSALMTAPPTVALSLRLIHRSHLPADQARTRVPRLSPTQPKQGTGRITCRGDTPPDRNTAHKNLQSGSAGGRAIGEFMAMYTFCYVM